MIDWEGVGPEQTTAWKWKHFKCIVTKIGSGWEGRIDAFGLYGHIVLFTSNFPTKDEAKTAVELYLKEMIEE